MNRVHHISRRYLEQKPSIDKIRTANAMRRRRRALQQSVNNRKARKNR